MATAKEKDEILELMRLQIAELQEKLNAQAEQKAAKEKEQTEEERKLEEWLNEKVTIQLFKDGKEYKDDKFVAINGVNRVVKRGVPVQIERKYALVIEQAQNQATAANEFSLMKESEGAEALGKLN